MSPSDKDMDERRKQAADKIITKMYMDGNKQEDIAAQKKANKAAFGHAGDIDADN